MKLTLRGVLAAVFVLAVAAGCVRLGFWQLDRLEQRRARNAAIRAAGALPPLPVDSVAHALAADPWAFEWRRARAAGRYHHAGDMVLRGRSRGGRPGVHLVSPLVLADGRVLMVNRGWVPSPDGSTADVRLLRTTGPVRVVGALLPIRSGRDRGLPLPGGSTGADTTWRRVDLAAARERSPGLVIPLVLQQLPPGGAEGPPPVPEPLPGLSEGNHLSYAVQWFSFAAIAVAGFLIVALRRPKSV